MGKIELIEAAAKASGASKKVAGDVINAALEAIVKDLKKGETVTIPGFGTFSTRVAAAHTAKNPRTGEAVKVKAKTVAKFKAGKNLKEALN